MVGKPLHNSLKNFPWNLQFSSGISASFLKIKRVKNPLNFSVYHCQVFSKCSRIQNVDFFKCILLIHQSMKHFLDCHRYSVPLISFLDNLNHRCSTYFTTARRFSRVQDILWKYSFNTIENLKKFKTTMKYFWTQTYLIVQDAYKIWKCWKSWKTSGFTEIQGNLESNLEKSWEFKISIFCFKRASYNLLTLFITLLIHGYHSG